MAEQIVFHIDESNKWLTLVSNIQNVIEDIPKVQIEVVVNGAAIELYLQADVIEFVKNYPLVQFDACHHALASHDISTDQLDSHIQVVPGGIGQLLKLEQSGYAYIKP